MVPRPEHLRAVELDVRLLAAPGRPGGAHGAEAVGQSGPRGEGREDPLVLAPADHPVEGVLAARGGGAGPVR